jgi:cytochrome c
MPHRSTRGDKAMRIAVLLAALGCTVAVAAADDARERAFRGKRLAEANCATCHAIAQFDASSLRTAPPLRTLGRTIAFERLRAMLGGQVFLRHAVMPDFQPDTVQADDLATYMQSIASDR